MSRFDAEILERVYRPDASTDLSGWVPAHARFPKLAGASTERVEGPYSSRVRGDIPRSTISSSGDTRTVADRFRVDAPVRIPSLARESLLERYHRSGSSVTSSSVDGTRPRSVESTPEPSLSRARLAAPERRTAAPSSATGTLGARDAARKRAPTNAPLSAADQHRKETESLARLSNLNASKPGIAKKSVLRGEALAAATSIGVQAGLSAAFGVTTPHSTSCWWWNGGAQGCWSGCHASSCWCPGAWWWWGCSSFCWPYWGSCVGFDYWFNTCGFWGYGSPYYVAPYAYYCAPAPVYYTYIVEDYSAEQPAAEPLAYESEAAVGEGHVYSTAQESLDSTTRAPAERSNASATQAANQFLSLGDRAFRDGRFSDAVYAYAKAVELVPDDGVLHLILSDALFATGDYHYCAFALRRAIELDPKLVESVVDKRSFYGDAHEFDRELALLERYVEDHFLDDDARLVLAANYLFSNRPDLAADLLQSAFSLSVRESPAGHVIAARAQALRQSGAAKR